MLANAVFQSEAEKPSIAETAYAHPGGIRRCQSVTFW
jgi:hypothetical protein